MGWRRSVAAIPLALGGIFALQVSEYLLLRIHLSPQWYHAVTALIQAAIALILLHLYWGWQDQAEETRRAYERLANLERLRDGMTAMLIHDLKNPVTVIGAALSVVLSGSQGTEELTESHREFVETAANSTQRLARMIDDVVDVARAETGTLVLELSPVELGQMTQQAVREVRPAADAKEVKLLEEYADGLKVVADAKKLRRVLDNMLERAVKLTPPAGQVEVRLAPRGGEVWIRVKNTGEAISPELQELIFDKFGQVETGRRVGVGFGLPFCKLAVEAHGGRIWVESHPREGNEFIVALPLGSDQGPPP